MSQASTPGKSPHFVREQEKKELQVLNTKLESYGAWGRLGQAYTRPKRISGFRSSLSLAPRAPAVLRASGLASERDRLVSGRDLRGRAGSCSPAPAPHAGVFCRHAEPFGRGSPVVPPQATELNHLKDFYTREKTEIIAKYEAELALLREYVARRDGIVLPCRALPHPCAPGVDSGPLS